MGPKVRFMKYTNRHRQTKRMIKVYDKRKNIYIYICIYICKLRKNLVKKNPECKIYILSGQTQKHRNTGGRKRWESGCKFSVWVRKVVLILPGFILISLLKDSTFLR